VVGERGRNLSSGEAQLLAFARVAARSPTLLILDEATASVDSMTEHKVQAAIEELLRGRSVLVIAHRLSTVRKADKILVMQDGQIVEQGSHEVLLARGGVYAELYRMGFKEPEPQAPTARIRRAFGVGNTQSGPPVRRRHEHPSQPSAPAGYAPRTPCWPSSACRSSAPARPP
jgi:ABC-type multidrug transport system ATPase subunit